MGTFIKIQDQLDEKDALDFPAHDKITRKTLICPSYGPFTWVIWISLAPKATPLI